VLLQDCNLAPKALSSTKLILIVVKQIADILPKGNPLESQSSHIYSTSFVSFLESKTKSLGRKLTKEEIAQSRAEWKQEYHKSYHLKRKVKEKRLSLRFSSSV